jgi:hypothetical protein
MTMVSIGIRLFLDISTSTGQALRFSMLTECLKSLAGGVPVAPVSVWSSGRFQNFIGLAGLNRD